MVNGPRPASIQKPAGGTPRPMGMLTAAVTPSSSTPTLLQRQATSVYSVVTSTGTPVLVYGKQATPLAGAWSAEPWSPSELRAVPFTERLSEPPMELLANAHEADEDHVAHFDDYNDTATTERETASVADTAAFANDQRNELELGSPVHVTASEPQQPIQVQSATNSLHIAHRYRNDPYSMYGQRELFRCTCDDCFSTGVTGRDPLADLTDELSAGMYATASFAPTSAAFEETGMAYDGAESAGAVHEADLYWGPSRGQEAPTTSFMPPPPPPRIARRVMRESAESSLDVDVAFYHIAMRWYGRVAAIQDKFVEADELCPEPGTDMQSFDEWADAVGRWWLRNFEHRQVKPATASAGLLRSSYTAARARTATPAAPPTPAAPFSTHANTATTAVRHPALRQEPRRQFGISGLTEEMLTHHNRVAAGGLPTPRSLEVRRRNDLPW